MLRIKVKTYYLSADHQVFPHTGKVISPLGSELKVRAKTFQLLLLLVEARGEIVSKETILNHIWDDVVVDDQVIFQSIKEIRKLFSGNDVIKTFPRKGYAWIASVEEMHLQQTSMKAEVKDEPNQDLRTSRLRIIPNKTIAYASLMITVLTLIYMPAGTTIKGDREISGSLVVLPVQNELTDTDHKWVHYGAMDQLIQRLSSSDNLGVLQTDYVMEVMKRADMPIYNFKQKDIQQIFQVSGASVVVQMRLTGSTRDYRLIYTLHQPDALERGAVLDSSVAGAIDQLAEIVANKLGRSSTAEFTSYHSAFSNEMLAHALELIQEDKKNDATKLLQAAITTEPGNLTAKRILSSLLIEQGKYSNADILIAQSIEQAITSNDTNELPRLRLWQGINKLQVGDIDEAIEILTQTKIEASQLKDWLLLAQVAEVMGRIHQYKKEYKLAHQRYSQAMDYHKILQCPYGQSNMLLNMSELAFAQDNIELAQHNAQMSYDLIKRRELTVLQPRIQSWLQRINSSHNNTSVK